MKYKSVGLAVLLAAFAASASAQTQISGNSKCGKADTSQSIEAGDQAGHVLAIDKVSCTWSAPLEMAGLKSTTYSIAESVDVTATKYQARGYVVMAMDNGDKAYIRFEGMGSMKEGTATGGGFWYYTGGTGKLKGLKGKGTYKGSAAPDGTSESQVEGTYSLPEPSAPAKKK